MSSQRRINASRANGARSRGPVSIEGKQRASLNAVRHGLVAATVVLAGESAEGFQSLVAAFVQRFQPADEIELSLVEDMAAAQWRQRRAWAIERSMLDDAMAASGAGDKMDRLTRGFSTLAAGPELALIHRYDTRQSRIFQRALNNLIALRKDFVPNEPNPISEHGLDLDRPVPESASAATTAAPPLELVAAASAPAPADSGPIPAPAPEPAAPPSTPEPSFFQSLCGDFLAISAGAAAPSKPKPPTQL